MIHFLYFKMVSINCQLHYLLLATADISFWSVLSTEARRTQSHNIASGEVCVCLSECIHMTKWLTSPLVMLTSEWWIHAHTHTHSYTHSKYADLLDTFIKTRVDANPSVRCGKIYAHLTCFVENAKYISRDICKLFQFKQSCQFSIVKKGKVCGLCTLRKRETT